MDWLDIALLIILAIVTIRGFFKGFVLEVASLVALVIASIAALKLMHYVGAILEKSTDLSGNVVLVIAFIGIFAVVVLLVHLMARLAQKLLKAAALGPANRIAGGAFAFLKTGFILSIVLWLFSYASFFQKDDLLEKPVAGPILRAAPITLNVLSQIIPRAGDALDDIGAFFEKLPEEIDEQL